jgi:hypothetical protein
MKHKHRKRLERAKAAFQAAGRQIAENRLEDRRWHKPREERTLEELAIGTAYEDLETIVEGSVGLIDAILEDRLAAFLDTMRASNDEDDEEPQG